MACLTPRLAKYLFPGLTVADRSLRKRFVPAGSFSLMYFNSKKPVSDTTLVRELEEMEVVVVKAQPAPPLLVRRSSLSLQQISEISLRVDLRIDAFDGQYVFCRLDPGTPLLTPGDTCESIIRKVVAKRALPPSRHYALKTAMNGPPFAMNTRITETTGCGTTDHRLLLVHSLAGDFCSSCSAPRAEEPFHLENGKTLCPPCEALAARPRCALCATSLEDEIVPVAGKSYHPGCAPACCFHCKLPLEVCEGLTSGRISHFQRESLPQDLLRVR